MRRFFGNDNPQKNIGENRGAETKGEKDKQNSYDNRINSKVVGDAATDARDEAVALGAIETFHGLLRNIVIHAAIIIYFSHMANNASQIDVRSVYLNPVFSRK